MKKYQSSLLFATICVLFLFSCTKDKALVTRTTYLENAGVYKSVTKEEYLKASILERRFIDQIDGAVNALDILKKNNPQQDYVAIITIDKDPNNKLHNSILIGIAENKNDDMKTDADADPAPDGKCHVCGLISAYSCISEVEKYMDAKNQDSISATITRSADNCVDIKYH
ncbi:MAG: hypothetical protein KA527_04510 [Cytophagaceae bacterium]|nr:hypothetical protein [Cytophagaceae bacterium]MBP6093790.1 hypothetical protein [Cytophagaceae bacterium]